MKAMTRREAAGLAAAIALPLSRPLFADEPADEVSADATRENGDTYLANATSNSGAYQLRPVGSIDLIGEDGYPMIISSAFGIDRKPVYVRIKSYSMRIFRADSQGNGGVFHWRYKDQQGAFQSIQSQLGASSDQS